MTKKTYIQTITKNGKSYSYVKQFNFPKEEIGDLILLIGAPAVLLLLHYFEGSYLYIPKKNSVKRKIIEACFHSEATAFLKQGISKKEIIKRLSELFPNFYTTSSIEKILQNYSREEGIRKARRGCLLAEVKRNKELFLNNRYI